MTNIRVWSKNKFLPLPLRTICYKILLRGSQQSNHIKGMRRAVGEQSRERHLYCARNKVKIVFAAAHTFFVLCEHYLPSVLRYRHAARPAADGFRHATSQFVSISTRRISK